MDDDEYNNVKYDGDGGGGDDDNKDGDENCD